jgi:Ca2+-transporting ATPase
MGDPTEAALLLAAQRAGITDTGFERRDEIPFESTRKLMSVLVKDREGSSLLLTKGAPDVLLARCSRYLVGGKPVELGSQERQELARINDSYAAEGLRVLGVALRPWSGPLDVARPEQAERDLTFVGLLAMYDPPRPEVRAALRLCMVAGIRVIMITGDQALTATSIAREIGLPGNVTRAVTGAEIEELSESKLRQLVRSHNVFARVSPEHKLRIVRALKREGQVVAMTGDGINDAPALREADIGVSMGLCGTEVAREASSLVLQDDNFASIVDAIREGRGIYDNIRKFSRYLLACNVGELLTVFLAMALGLPLPLRPIQILWVNLVTDGLPAMALGVDQPDRDIMQRKPRPKTEGLFSRGLGRKILTRGVLIGLSTVAVFATSYALHEDLPRAQTMAFATLVMCQMFHVFDCRSETLGIVDKGIFTNRLLILALAISFGMFLTSIHLPALRDLFGTVALDMRQWSIVLAASGLPTVVVGLRRLVRYRLR